MKVYLGPTGVYLIPPVCRVFRSVHVRSQSLEASAAAVDMARSCRAAVWLLDAARLHTADVYPAEVQPPGGNTHTHTHTHTHSHTHTNRVTRLLILKMNTWLFVIRNGMKMKRFNLIQLHTTFPVMRSLTVGLLFLCRRFRWMLCFR